MWSRLSFTIFNLIGGHIIQDQEVKSMIFVKRDLNHLRSNTLQTTLNKKCRSSLYTICTLSKWPLLHSLLEIHPVHYGERHCSFSPVCQDIAGTLIRQSRLLNKINKNTISVIFLYLTLVPRDLWKISLLAIKPPSVRLG